MSTQAITPIIDLIHNDKQVIPGFPVRDNWYFERYGSPCYLSSQCFKTETDARFAFANGSIVWTSVYNEVTEITN